MGFMSWKIYTGVSAVAVLGRIYHHVDFFFFASVSRRQNARVWWSRAIGTGPRKPFDTAQEEIYRSKQNPAAGRRSH